MIRSDEEAIKTQEAGQESELLSGPTKLGDT